jgi:hypothetical protein
VLPDEVFPKQFQAERKTEERRVLGASTLNCRSFTSFSSKLDAKAALDRLDLALYGPLDRFHAKQGDVRLLEVCTSRHERGATS